MRALIEGIDRYERLYRNRYRERFAELADGQNPSAMFITCSDSRVVPTLLAAAEPGELFVVRNVANLVPPYDPSSPAGDSVASAVWYAVEVLGVRDIIVCGHSGCGGIKALAGAEPPEFPPLRRWLASALVSVDTWRRFGPYDASLSMVDQLSQMSTRHQLDNLKTHPSILDRVASGELRLHAWWFDIPRARMLAHSEGKGRFVPAVDLLVDVDVEEPKTDVA